MYVRRTVHVCANLQMCMRASVCACEPGHTDIRVHACKCVRVCMYMCTAVVTCASCMGVMTNACVLQVPISESEFNVRHMAGATAGDVVVPLTISGATMAADKSTTGISSSAIPTVVGSGGGGGGGGAFSSYALPS